MRLRRAENRLNRAAVSSLAALAVCLVVMMLTGGVTATALAGDKTRSRAERALRQGEYVMAEKLFRELLAKDVNDKNAHLGLSFSLLKQRNLHGAFDHAARAVAIDPSSARAHALVGNVVLAAGDFQTAVSEFLVALKLRDDEAMAVAGLAMVHFYENRFFDSFAGLSRAVALDGDEPDYLYNLAQAASRIERFKESADAYERFLRVAKHTDAERRDRIRGLISFLRYLSKVTDLYVMEGAARAVVPFSASDNRPVIQVRVNGVKEPLRLLLDTGSGMSVISDAAARRVGVSAVARGGFARGIGGNGRFDIVYGFLSSIEVGGARVRNVPVYIRPLFNRESAVDGYIGLTVISKFLTTVDYGSRTFTIDRQFAATERAAEPKPSASVEIPLRTTLGGYLSGEVRLEGVERPLNFIIDTGASVSVVSQLLAAREEMDRFAGQTKMRVYGAAGVAEDVKLLVLPRVTLGSFVRESVPAVVLDLNAINETSGFDQTGIIGGNFLRHFRITFDFQRGKVRLEPLTPAATTRPEVKDTVPIKALAEQP
jgi:predicted aspartyl protease/tetratricopeptide (TPR) repeat protein